MICRHARRATPEATGSEKGDLPSLDDTSCCGHHPKQGLIFQRRLRYAVKCSGGFRLNPFDGVGTQPITDRGCPRPQTVRISGDFKAYLRANIPSEVSPLFSHLGRYALDIREQTRIRIAVRFDDVNDLRRRCRGLSEKKRLRKQLRRRKGAPWPSRGIPNSKSHHQGERCDLGTQRKFKGLSELALGLKRAFEPHLDFLAQ